MACANPHKKNNEVTNIKGRVYCLLTNEMRFVSIFFNYYYYIISVDSKASAIRISSGCVNLIFLRSPSAIYKGKRFSSAIRVYKDCAQIDFCLLPGKLSPKSLKNKSMRSLRLIHLFTRKKQTIRRKLHLQYT